MERQPKWTVYNCTGITTTEDHRKLLGATRAHEILVVVCEDGQPAKPPHTDTARNITEMERSQPRNSMMQLLGVLQKINML